ncbi:MAG: hypothetical protein FWG57_05685 [Endomicrobia bacterium]|nr:hypothetical protein [Endomicrobiia bacterium]
MSDSIKTASKIIKFVSIAVISGFCVFAADHYYRIENHARELLPKLSMTVFIDKNCNDDAQVCEAIEALGFVTVSEYVHSKNVYDKAVEKNPFLKDVSVPGDSEIFQSYVKASPSSFPTEDFLVAARNAVSGVENVSEVVFNPEVFKEYARVKNLLDFYRKILLIFAVIIIVLLISQSILFILESEDNTRKFIIGAISYLIAASIGFVVVWGICLFMQYPLIINEIAAFYIIPLTAAFGIIFNENCRS